MRKKSDMVENTVPRTLIVGAQFSEHSGTGTFLSMLFANWRPESLATVYDDQLPVDLSRCSRHYEVGSRENRWRWPVCYLAPQRRSGPCLPASSRPALEANAKAAQWGLFLSRKRFRSQARCMVRLLCREDLFVETRLSNDLLSWIRSFEPEVIYGRPSTLGGNRLLREIHQAVRKPLVLHYMDDWPENLYRKGLLEWCFRPAYLREFRELVGLADANLAICREMAEAYQRRYGFEFQWLENPVNMQEYRGLSRAEWSVGRPFTIRYGGRIGWAIRQSLLDLACVVHEMRREKVDVAFDIYSADGYLIAKECGRYNGVAVRPLGPHRELARSQCKADVLFICYDFDPSSVRLARFSMPGKLGECLATGTPILIYGPKGLPVVEYARREKWGRVVDERSHLLLRGALTDLIRLASERERLGRASMQLAQSRHDSAIVSERLRGIIQSAIGRRCTC